MFNSRATRQRDSAGPRGFTMVELILVIFIMVLLTGMSVPMFYQFVKTSKVQQTVKAVSTSLYRARMEAMRTRKMVGVFFGDDVAMCATQPLPGILPSKGRIEVWIVRDHNSDGLVTANLGPESDEWQFSDESGCMGSALPFNYPYAGANWFPYRYPDRCLTPEPITFPDGVRILAGKFNNNASAPKYVFGWPSDYMATAEGEIKRHTITLGYQGAMAGPFDGANTWWNLLIFDEQTGEYALLNCGEWLSTSRPRLLKFQLNGLYGPSGTFYPINTNRDITQNIEK